MNKNSEEQCLDAAFTQWFHTPMGRYSRAWQHKQVSALIGNVFGYHAVQVGMPHWDLLRNSRIVHKFCTHDVVDEQFNRKGLVVCHSHELPFESQSIDLLVLPHALESTMFPHQVLREVERVLRPEGRVIIIGFQPFSLWGLTERIPGLAEHMPIAPSRHVSLGRVADWLQLLSFDIEESAQGCYAPYCTQRKWLQRWLFMDRIAQRGWVLPGGVYALRAVKKVNAMTLVGLDWKNSKKMATGRAAVAGAQRQHKG